LRLITFIVVLSKIFRMIKPGDKVRFLNAVGGGVVKSIINKTMVSVEDSDGFEIPTLISQLVVIDEPETKMRPQRSQAVQTESPFSAEPAKKEITKAEPKIIDGKDAPACFFVFVPQDEANPLEGELKAYLINDSNNFLLFNYSHLKNKVYRSMESGKMNPNSKRYLESFSRFNLNDLPEFHFQLITFKSESTQIDLPMTKCLNINPMKFYRQGSYVKTKYFPMGVIIHSLLEPDLSSEMEKLAATDLHQVIMEKDKPKVEEKPVVMPDLVEIDLHIHELLEDTRGLSNHEMLEVQLGRFRNELDTAIVNGTRRIVFIHGVGNGTLKQELRKELSTTYKKYYFQDASFKEYGYGATMVILKNA